MSDVVLEQEVPVGKHGEDEDTELARASVQLYEELGVAPKVKKVKTLERRVVPLGADVHGDSGRCTVPPRVISQLMAVTLLLMNLREIPNEAAEKLTGSWVLPLMLRRSGFC